MKILLVEDNEQLNKALTALLKRNQYIVDSSFDGEEALHNISTYQYDIIILDIMIPKINGLDVLKDIRSKHIQTPVIMLTAKSTIEDKIAGLDSGADDYLAKPFNTEELLARIRALSRRIVKNYSEIKEITFGDLVIDESNFAVKCKDKEVTLTSKEMNILLLLVNANGKVVTVECILEKAWDMNSYAIDANVWVFISYLRNKLQKVGSKAKIKAIRKLGYRLEA